MTNVRILPSTMGGIKRLAKSLKRERNLTHHQALDEAAKRAGFENIRHAQHAIPPVPAPTPGHASHVVFLTAYWRTQHGTSGRETLRRELPLPLRAFGTPATMRRGRNLGGFKLEFADHLEHEVDFDTQGDARFALIAASRTLSFMAVTGLRPASQRLESKLWPLFNSLPGRDHPSCWVDSETEEWVFLNEPYGPAAASDAVMGQILAWATAAGLGLVVPRWEGLYSPGSTRPFLFCSSNELGLRLKRQMDTLANHDGTAWDGLSYAYEPFVSPARDQSAKPRRARPAPAPRGVARAGALPYGATRGGMASRWRPATALPLQTHLTIGPLLGALCNSSLPKMAARRLAGLRSELDDWLQMEYPGDKMTPEQFHSAYYGTHRQSIQDRDAQLAAVDQVIRAIEAGYVSCAPARQVLKRLREARAAILTPGGR